MQLEVYENETGVLRKKVDNLLTDNLKLSKEIKEINNKLAEEKKKKTTTGMYSSSRMSDKESSKIDDIQNELNDTRVKLIEKEREVERLDAQLKLSSKGKITLNIFDIIHTQQCIYIYILRTLLL